MAQPQLRLKTGDRIAIAVAALATAAAIGVVAFEHAYPEATRATWRIILFACVIIAVAAIFYLIFDLVIRPRWHDRSNGKKPIASSDAVTPNDIAYNAALAAGGISWVAAFIKGRKLAFVFALIATAAIAFDYWTYPREFIWAGTAFKGYPVAWRVLSVGTGVGDDFQIETLRFGGRNDSEKEVVLNDAYIISGMTGAQMPLEVLFLGKSAAIKDINPIPAKAVITLDADLDSEKGISISEFRKSWGIFSLVVKVDGEVHRYDYDRAVVEKILKHEKFDFDAIPRVTLKNPKDAQ